MYILQSAERVGTEEGELLPLVRYVLPHGPGGVIAERLKAEGAPFTLTHFNSFERRFASQDANGRRLLFYRHAAVGDSLMATGLAAFIRHQWPECRLDIYCAPRAAALWAGLGHHVYPGFIHFDAARRYDWHLCFDSMLENNSEPDQRCAYDDFYQFIGQDPAGVLPEFKRPRAVILPEDRRVQLPAGRPWIVYHLQAANPNRTYPPALGAVVCEKLAAAFPRHLILVVGDPKRGEERPFARFENHDQICLLAGRTKSFRHLFPLVAEAAMVICPDSAVGHLAGAFPGVPVISLWGLFHPDDRVKYYANHHPLGPPDACPHAPCRNHEFTLPQHLCKDAANATPGKQAWCNALRAIAPEAIVEQARQLI